LRKPAKYVLDLSNVAGVGFRDAEILDQLQNGIRIDRFDGNRVAKYIIDSDLGVLSSAVSGAELMSRFADAHDSYSVNPAMVSRNSCNSYADLGKAGAGSSRLGKTWAHITELSNGNPALRTGFHCSNPRSSFTSTLVSISVARIFALHFSVALEIRYASWLSVVFG
jgi:hypothetical protein